MFKNFIILVSLVAVAAGFITVQDVSEPYDDRNTTEFPDLSNDCNNVTKTNSNERYESQKKVNFMEDNGSEVPMSEEIELIEELTTADPFDGEETLKKQNASENLESYIMLVFCLYLNEIRINNYLLNNSV